MENIIVLTSGLSGSSVVTHLLSRAGYWSGHSTSKKSDYDTHENSRLVELNKQLLKTLNYDHDYSKVVIVEKTLQAAELVNTIDISPFKAFVDECSNQAPWIWKDPRLWVTMPFWIQLLDKNDFLVLVVDRELSQRWISENLRRNIQSYSYCKQYNVQIKEIIDSFISQHGLKANLLVFDMLIKNPELTLCNINEFVGSSLSMDDLLSIYNKPLYNKTRSYHDLLLAILIYLKNYKSALNT